MSNYHYAPGAIHNDNHKEVSINLSSSDAERFLADFFADNQPEDKGAEIVPVDNLCPYIQVDKLREVGTYTPEQFNRLLQQEATQQAPQFAKFLHKHEKSGYMNFGNHNKQQVFDTLRAYCPKMRQYTYGNFALYF